METSLHRDLKRIYAGSPEHVEVAFEDFRIDAIDADGHLVEIQHAGLGSIQKKVRVLTANHRVRVVKPLIRTKWIETYESGSNNKVKSRKSPRHATFLELFPELLHFTSAFPHPNLILEVVLVDVIEKREPRPHRYRRKKQFRVLDQVLKDCGDSQQFRKAEDLWKLLNIPSPKTDFGTQEISLWLDRPRWFAQQVAYVLDRCGAIRQVGKEGNAKRYRKTTRRTRAA